MHTHKDISTLEDIKFMVDAFYEKVRQDEVLGDIFNGVIQDRWPQHLEKMYRFWQTILLKEHTYFGSPFNPHTKLPVDATHFDRWKKLFFRTIDENYRGEKAEEAKTRAERMAEIFQVKIQHFQNINPGSSE